MNILLEGTLSPLEKSAVSLYRHGHHVLVHAQGVADYMRAHGISQVSVLPNWVDTDSIRPSRQEQAPSLTALCAGNLGLAQGTEQLVRLADQSRDLPVRFRFVGDGPRKAALLIPANEED